MPPPPLPPLTSSPQAIGPWARMDIFHTEQSHQSKQHIIELCLSTLLLNLFCNQIIKWAKKTNIGTKICLKFLFLIKTFLVGPYEWGFWLLKGPRKKLLQMAFRSADWLSSDRGQRSEGKLKLAKISTKGVNPGNNRALTWWSCESLLLPLLNARSSYNSAEFVVIGEYNRVTYCAEYTSMMIN